MGVIIPQVVTTDRASGAQVIDGSLKFDKSKTTHLKRTFGSGNVKTWTWSGWFKRTHFDSSGNFYRIFGQSETNHFFFYEDDLYFDAGNSSDARLITNRKFRDTGWYHLVGVFDTDNGTTGDRMRLYINGERVTSFSTANYPTSGYSSGTISSAAVHDIGYRISPAGGALSADMSQIYFIDGQALDASYFGYTDGLTNTWKPKKYEGTFGTNGFYLPMDGNSPIGEDKSGIATPNNGSIWSNSLTASTGFRSSEPKQNAFDGDTSSICSAVNDGTITFTSPVTFASDSTIKVVVHGGNHTVTVNGGADQTISAGSLQTVTYSNSGNATFVMTFKRDTSADTGVRAIEINGVILTDGLKGNSWTPVNFGGSVALDNPQVSGARPILNTTQGGTQAGVGVFGSKQNVGYAVTVYDDGGGNKYYIDGVKQATLTGLIRGATYTFDQSDSTNNTHPLVFGTTANGNDFNGATVTSASAGSAGAATTITIPYDAPNTIYYHCSAHSGMGADITGITTNEKLADQYASNCVLAVTFANGNATATDVSPSIACTATAHTLTKQGDPVTNTSVNFYSSSVDFDGTGDYYKSASSSDFAFGTGDFTIEYWIDSDDLAGNQYGHLQISSSSTGLQENYDAGLAIYESPIVGAIAVPGLTGISIPSTGRLIKAGVWNHIALVREGTNARLYINGFLADSSTDSKDVTGTYLGIGGYYNTNYLYNGRMQDLRIYKGAAKYNGSFEVPVTFPAILPDTPSGVGGGSKLTKITDGAVAFDGNGDYLEIANSTDLDQEGDFTQECFYYQNGDGQGSVDIIFYKNVTNYGYIGIDFGGTNQIKFQQHNIGNLITGPVMASKRWYHLAATRSGSTVRLFVDGVLVGSTTYSTDTTGTAVSRIGGAAGAHSNYGFISNLRVLKGTALYTKNFTPPTEPLTNVTNTKLLCCQSNTSATEVAVSPSTPTANGNAAATNFTPFNTDINTVRGQETGYCTLNPLTNYIESSTYTLPVISDGNLTVKASTTRFSGVCGDIFATSGKFYAEVTKVSGQTTDDSIGFGARTFKPSLDGNVYIGRTSDSYGFYGSGGSGGAGRKIHNNGFSDYGSSWGALGDVMGLLMDLDNGTFSLAINNINQGVAYSSIDASLGWTFTVAPYNNQEYDVNFGQKPFKFPPPDGFQPLNTANTRPVNVISDPDQYVGVTTFTGNGGTQSIDVGHEPDLIWIKDRDDGEHHGLFDTIRGPLMRLTSDYNYASTSRANTVTSFNHNGVTLGSAGEYNGSDDAIVAWSWRAGGSKNTFNVDDVGYASAAAAGLTGGDITPSGASVGTKQGFSIVKFTGPGSAGFQSVPHGLSEKPKFILCKDLDNARNWSVFHEDVITADNKTFYLNNDLAVGTSDTNTWDVSAIDATTFTPYFRDDYGASYGADNIAYLWHDVPGLQKFGSFTGNGNADGPYIELGFRPAIVLLKSTSAGGTGYSWVLYDNERGPINPNFNFLCPDSANKENRREGDTADKTDRYIDFLSNGFKIRNSNANYNGSGNTLIYAAWAEAPSVNLYGGGANAR